MSEMGRGATAPKVVLVTGASRFIGGYLVTRLAQNPAIARVLAVDAVPPSKDMLRRMGRAEFVRADIRNPLIGKVIRTAGVDTVVHASTAAFSTARGGRSTLKEMNVLGAMQLLAACQKAPSMRRVVLMSSSAIYGCTSKDPVKFTEEMSARIAPNGGFPQDCIDVESYTRSLARRRPDIAVSMLRMASVIGPHMETELTRYIAPPLIPTVFGRDARLQLLHEEDALAALERATLTGIPGTFNIAANGMLVLSQAIRRAGRIDIPIPAPLFGMLGGFLGGSGVRQLNRDQIKYLKFGRGLDTTRMRSELGFTPRWTTEQAFDDFVRGRALTPVIKRDTVRAVETRVVDFAARLV